MSLTSTPTASITSIPTASEATACAQTVIDFNGWVYPYKLPPPTLSPSSPGRERIWRGMPLGYLFRQDAAEVVQSDTYHEIVGDNLNTPFGYFWTRQYEVAVGFALGNRPYGDGALVDAWSNPYRRRPIWDLRRSLVLLGVVVSVELHEDDTYEGNRGQRWGEDAVFWKTESNATTHGNAMQFAPDIWREVNYWATLRTWDPDLCYCVRIHPPRTGLELQRRASHLAPYTYRPDRYFLLRQEMLTGLR